MSYRIQGRFVSKAAYEQHHNKQQITPLPELMRRVHPAKVDAMSRKLVAEYKERELYEHLRNPNGSGVLLRRIRSLIISKDLARLCCVLGVNPSDLLNRERQSGRRSDLKGVEKLRGLIKYIMGRSRRFERVNLALFAASIIAANRGLGWISSSQQELILSSLDVAGLPEDVQDAIKDYQHKFISAADSRPSACRFRTTFENLNCYEIENQDTDYTNENGILINMHSPLIQFLNDKWELDKVS